ncbi:Aste57867_23772 [Aphanomyces stellatus]|uniref:Aste57867_23772 protein n=1 Tax=Aphanomyces stellatus TaxID=120398 RepID=A0A485LNJ1_9STRA|nr:hypothetical protein As57867_023699 [Aphanomyces stellatus]VFU00417.1 Aste57867_23772 [Aphanomyces stellatus]
MPLLLLATILAVAAVATTTSPPCTPAQFTAVHNSSFLSAYFIPCAVDMSLPSGTDLTEFQPTPAQLAAARDSDSCQWLFGDVQVAAAAAHCEDLDVVANNITYNMFLSWVDIRALPKAAVACNRTQLAATLAATAAVSSFAPCLAAAGMNATSTTFATVPTPDQLTQLRNNDQCTSLFGELQAALDHAAAANDCAILGTGTPLHAIGRLSFDSAMDWLGLLSAIHFQASPHSSAVIEFGTHPEMQHGAAVVLSTMLAGTCLAAVVFVVYSYHRVGVVPPAMEERHRLLV